MKTQLPPIIYHLTPATNWPFIKQRGLLSTQALLDLAPLSDDERERIGQHHRVGQVVLPNGVVVNHQKPMSPSVLARCLHGITPTQWYILLNSKVFFWLDTERLNRLRRASLMLPHVVLLVDAQALLVQYAERVTLTPINTGNARRQPAQRSRATFVPYATWATSGWASETEPLSTRPRPRSHRPVELTVAYAVPDVMDFVVEVRHLAPQEMLSF